MNLFDFNFVVSDVSFGIFLPVNRTRFEFLKRKSHTLAYNIDCTTTYRFSNRKEVICGPSQCVFLPDGSSYTVSVSGTSPDAGTYAINFSTFDTPTTVAPFVLSIRGRNRVRSCFEKAEQAWRAHHVGYLDECFSALYRLISLLRREMHAYSSLGKTLNKLDPALQYIEDHYTLDTISTSHLASLCSISEPYLRRLFQSAFSASPAVYIRNLRLNYAKELLSTGEYPVTTAASLAGFNNVTYFSREFKKYTGVSPYSYLSQNPSTSTV